MTDGAILALRQSCGGGLLSLSEVKRLAELAAASSRILEIGRWRGFSTAILIDSAPRGALVVSVDHQKGDRWAPAVPMTTVARNLAPFIERRADVAVSLIDAPMAEALPRLRSWLRRKAAGAGFDLVFYDADHTPEACASFTSLVGPLLYERGILAYDDADWSQQDVIATWAASQGFSDVTGRAFYRRKDGGDKLDASTYTLRVLARGGPPA